jgi:hypothetical protein
MNEKSINAAYDAWAKANPEEAAEELRKVAEERTAMLSNRGIVEGGSPLAVGLPPS